MKQGYILTNKHKVLGYDGLFNIDYAVARTILSPIGLEFKIIGYHKYGEMGDYHIDRIIDTKNNTIIYDYNNKKNLIPKLSARVDILKDSDECSDIYNIMYEINDRIAKARAKIRFKEAHKQNNKPMELD